MNISDPYIRIATGVNLSTDSPNFAGSTHIGLDHHHKPAGVKAILAARLIFSAESQTSSFVQATGVITLSAAGTAQVTTATVVAAAGATSAGNLALTLTSAKVVGSPLAITVPLVVATHTTAALIATAIRTKLATIAVVTDFFAISGEGVDVVLTSLFGFANDATLNLAITAGFGVTAAANSADTTAGVLGVLVERVGGDGNDIYGATWSPCTLIMSMTAQSHAPGTGFVEGDRFTNLPVGAVVGVSYPAGETDGINMVANGTGMVDLIAHCK